MSEKYHLCQSRKLKKNGSQLNFLKCQLFKRHEGNHTDGREEWTDDRDRSGSR